MSGSQKYLDALDAEVVADAPPAASAPPHGTRTPSKGPDPAIDAQHVARLLARADRWRYPSWPQVCQAADRARQRRDRLQPLAIRIRQPADPRSARGWHARVCRDGSGVLLSAVVHMGLVLVLAWWAVGLTPQGDSESLHVIRVHALREVHGPPLQPLEISLPSRAEVQSSGPFSAPLSAPTSQQDPGALPPAVSLAAFASVSSGPVGDARALFGHDGRGMTTIDDGQHGSEFFGIRATGNRFVFIVDSSRSMGDGGRWQDATRELLGAIERLTPQQSFYVIFFDGQTHPMFDARTPEPDLLPATAENLERVRSWIAAAELGPFTRPAASVQMGLRLQPDAIYLLSDGVFEDPTAALLRANNLVRKDGRRVPRVIVHTIGFHTQDGQRVLQRIAQENGGRYVFVPSPRMAHLDRDRQ